MSSRYYIVPPISAGPVTLEGREAHHLLHVMRCEPGDEVTLFDGQGFEYRAEIAECSRKAVTCEILDKHEVNRELPFTLTLAVALPKGDRQRWLVEKAVELGVTKLVPFQTQRSVALPKESSLDKLRQAVIEASKQCRRNTLMEIASPVPWEAFLASALSSEIKIIADPCGEPISVFASSSNVMLAIGPEGGFTEEEVEAAKQAAWHVASLGPRILRVETAAIALVSGIVMASLGE